MRKIERTPGLDGAFILEAKANYGNSLYHLSKYREAECIYLEVMEKSEELYGVGHSDTLTAHQNYALTLHHLKKYK